MFLTILAVGLFISIGLGFGYLAQPAKAAPLFPEIPTEESELEPLTTVEVSDNGNLLEPIKVPYGSNLHVIIVNGVVEVRLNQTTIPFSKQ